MRWAIRAQSSRPAWPVCCFAAVPSAVEGRVDEVDILLAHAILRKPQRLAEAYKMEITSLQMRHSILMESLVA